MSSQEALKIAAHAPPSDTSLVRDVATAVQPLVTVLRWLVAWAPAVAALWWISAYRMPVPFQDDWAFVMECQEMARDGLSLKQVFEPINGHSLAVPKLLFYAVHQWGRGDLSLLPLFTWGISLAASIGVAWLARGWLAGMKGAGWPVLLLWNLGWFSAAHEMTWFWNCTFHHYLPGCCLVGALVALHTRWPLALRLLLAGILSAVAAFSFGSGFLVPLLLVPCLWWQIRERSRGLRAGVLLLWGVLTSGMVFVAVFAFRGDGGHAGQLGQQLEHLSGVSHLTPHYLLVLCGLHLGTGFGMDPRTMCAVFGGLVVLLGGAGLLFVHRTTMEKSLPWLALGAWGAANIILIMVYRLEGDVSSALAPRYAANTHYIALAATALVLMARPMRAGSPGRRMLQLSMLLLLAGNLASWLEGIPNMQAEHGKMRQDRATIAFSSILPPERNVMWWFEQPDDTARCAGSLQESGKLRSVRLLPTVEIDHLHVGRELQNKWSCWEMMTDSAGSRIMVGKAAYSTAELPDLIAISEQQPGQPERIIAVTKPTLPTDFHQRREMRREHRAHFYGWRYTLPHAAATPDSGSTLRAYAFDSDTNRFNRLRYTPGWTLQ